MQKPTKTNSKLKLTTETITQLRETLTDEQLKAAQGGHEAMSKVASASNGGNC